MRNAVILSVVVAMVGLVGKAEAQGASQARGEFFALIENPCTGELLDISGKFHFVFRENGFSLNAHGSGLSDLGVQYQWIDNFGPVQISTGNSEVISDRTRFRLVGQGPSNNYWVTAKYHLTIVDGEIRASFDEFEIECR